jgi:hypothetical protein
VADPPEEAVLDCGVAVVAQPAVAEAFADEAVGVPPAALPVLEPRLDVLPGAEDVVSVVCVPLPSVPTVPICGGVPPFSTVELAWIIA